MTAPKATQNPLTVIDAVSAPVIALTITAAVQASGLGRTSIFEALRNRKLVARKNGQRTVIEADELRRYVQSLPQAEYSAAV